MSVPGPDIDDHHKYVSELVWIPTYIGITFLVIGTTGTTGVIVFVVLVLTRMALELLYRIVFGARRREFAIGAVAFVAQCLIWGGVWASYIAGK